MLDLKARLAALQGKKHEDAPLPKVYRYVSDHRIDEGLYAFSEKGLHRLGYDGVLEPEKLLFLDTETTGLSGGAGTTAFLVGLGRIENGRFRVRQYLMESFAAEPELLSECEKLIREAKTLVTFNGAAFDVPLLHDRFLFNRMEACTDGKEHIDLLKPARRLWKLRLKDCSLSHIEQSVMDIYRDGDLPGSEVPARYFEFQKTKDMALLNDIVKHNRQDIVSLMTLLVIVHDAFAEPTEQLSLLDVYSAGRTLQKEGETEAAEECFRSASKTVAAKTVTNLRENKNTAQAKHELSLMLKKQGRLDEAENIWQDMLLRHQMTVFACTELAKLYEHKKRDPEKALDYTITAMRDAGDEELSELEKRRQRLILILHRRTKTNGHI